MARTLPPLLATPTRDDAHGAAEALRGVLQDFPFVGTGFAAALAALLSLVCRFAIQGNVPLFPVRSTVRGSGKGLLIDALSIIGTGRPAPHWPQSDNDEEDRKRLVTVGLAGDACIHIDNVKYPLGSPALDLALTTASITDRLLGGNEKVEAPLNMVWFASGNNMQFQGDTARRVVPIDLDPQMEKPEERTGFAYPRLLEHVTLARPALVHAALTIVQAYSQAGTPTQGLSTYGSFQEWSDLVRSAVVWAIGADPCEGRKDLEAQSDPAYGRLATLLEAWPACYGNTSVSVAKALKETEKVLAREDALEQTTPPEEYTPNPETQKWRNLREALSNFDSTYRGREVNARVIGNALTTFARRVIGDKCLVRSETRSGGAYTWRVTSVASVTISNPSAESAKTNSENEYRNALLATPATRPPDSEATTGSPPTFPPASPPSPADGPWDLGPCEGASTRAVPPLAHSESTDTHPSGLCEGGSEGLSGRREMETDSPATNGTSWVKAIFPLATVPLMKRGRFCQACLSPRRHPKGLRLTGSPTRIAFSSQGENPNGLGLASRGATSLASAVP
jgi:hypothetical protein